MNDSILRMDNYFSDYERGSLALNSEFVSNDPVYGKHKNTTEFGQMLHSKSIEFIHPITKENIYYEVDIPDEFKEYLENIENN